MKNMLYGRSAFGAVIGAVLFVQAAPLLRAEANASYVIDGVATNYTSNSGEIFLTTWSGGGVNGNSMQVINGGSVSINGDAYIAAGGNNNSNSVLVRDSSSTFTSGSSLYIAYAGGVGNSLTVTTGGVMNTGSRCIIGNGASANRATVAGSGSKWILGGTLTVGGYALGSGNQMTIADGGFVTDTTGYIGQGHPDGQSDSNRVLVSGSIWSNSVSCLVGSRGSGNQLLVTNSGVVYAEVVKIGSEVDADNDNSITVTGPGSKLLNKASVSLGQRGKSNSGNQLLIADGAVYRGGLAYEGIASLWGGSRITVTGSGSICSNASYLSLDSTNSLCQVTVSNGGTLYSSYVAIGMLCDSPAFNNQVLVTGPGSQLISGGPLYIGLNAGANGNQFIVTNGGLLQANTLIANSGSGSSGNSISNIGGIFQFTVSNPTLTPNGFGAIGIDGGTVSFKGVEANVNCNQSGYALDSATKMAWSGANGFRLNAAYNSAGQNYTFTDTLGATNFARLELANASTYNGNVMIGGGGTLAVSGGASTNNGTLTLQSGGTVVVTMDGANDYLNVTGTANLGNATLQVVLNTDPTPLFPIHIVRTAGLGDTQFGNASINAVYGGKTYSMAVRYVGNDVVLNAATKGTVIQVR